MSLIESIALISGILLIISIIVNIILWNYAKQTVATIQNCEEISKDFFSYLSLYFEHLEKIHGMPNYYGDKTLLHFLNHTKELIEFIKEILSSDLKDFTSNQEVLMKILEDDNNKKAWTKEEKEQHVFYSKT